MKTTIVSLSLASLLPSIATADISGIWKAEFETQIGVQKYTFTLKQDGTNVTGKAEAELDGEKHSTELKEGKVEGDTIRFVEALNFQGNDISQGMHSYLKEKGVPHVWHVDENGHDEKTWRNNWYLFAQRIFQ